MQLAPSQRAEKLLLAVKLIDEVVSSLDGRAEQCPSCTLMHYQNRLHFESVRSLNGFARKLSEWSGKLRADTSEKQARKGP